MKNGVLILLILLSGSLAAQAPDSIIEIRLKLIEQSAKSEKKGLALSYSVINHSDQDIYIPYFGMADSYCVHYYEKDQSGWRELDILMNDYYQPNIDNGPLKKFKNIDNSISIMYQQKAKNYYEEQIKIIKDYSSQLGQSFYLWNNYRLFFIKAHQEMSDISVVSIDWLNTQNKDYRISFGNEARDANILIARKNSSQGIEKFPSVISGYRLFAPRQVQSNTVFYSALPLDAHTKKG